MTNRQPSCALNRTNFRRIYLAKDGVEIIMLSGGGSKSGQQRDIDQAVELWKEYKRAKANLLKKNKSIVMISKRKG